MTEAITVWAASTTVGRRDDDPRPICTRTRDVSGQVRIARRRLLERFPTVAHPSGAPTHAGCPLGDGWLEDGALRCGSRAGPSGLGTGAVLEGLAEGPLATHPLRVVDGRVEVDVP